MVIKSKKDPIKSTKDKIIGKCSICDKKIKSIEKHIIGWWPSKPKEKIILCEKC